LHLHKSFVAISNPNKNRFSSPLSWRAQAYKWKKWKRKRYKEDDEVVPTSPSTSSSSPKWVFLRLPLPKMVSPRESRRNRLNFATSAQVPLSVIPAPLSVQKCKPISAQRQKMREEWHSALNSAIFISSILAFFFFLLWLTTSLTWDKIFLSLNWTQKWGLVV